MRDPDERRAPPLSPARADGQAPPVDSHGGYRLVDAHTKFVVAGVRFEMNADDVIAFCNDPNA